jgi:AhpD family alkylhydroperoxidase
MTKRLHYGQIAPNAAKALGGVYGYKQSGLPSELVDVVYLRVSQINNCAFCLEHTHDLIRIGTKLEKLALVQASEEGGSPFRAAERAGFAWADGVTRVTETGVADSAYR